ncbi:MAG: iron transporter [Dehalococcoidia bacterium]|nr:iron transporter [Dehalococcoidia bacterium]
MNTHQSFVSPGADSVKERLRQGVRAGLRKGWKNFLWMTRILVPVSLAVALLVWSGWLYKLNFILEPAMRLINLPSEAAFPILNGIFINVYAVIAILAVVPFSPAQMTMIAVFSLIAHAIISEAIIQHKSGMNGMKMALIRLVAAVATVLVISFFLGDTTTSVASTTVAKAQEPFLRMLSGWALDTGLMLLKIFGIIMAIMVLLECLAWLGWDVYLYRFFRPFMKLLGLSDRTSVLWVTAVIFGLTYGSAVILEKSRQGALTRSELERLHISIGINHSMVEDPALYMALGLNAFWLIVPKLLMAMLAVQLYRLVGFFRGRGGTKSGVRMA